MSEKDEKPKSALHNKNRGENYGYNESGMQLAGG